jgi:hypothetical protein
MDLMISHLHKSFLEQDALAKSGSNTLTLSATNTYTSDFDASVYNDINRITYRMEVAVDGTLRYAEVTFDAWSGSLEATDLRVPDLSLGNSFVVQQIVNNMTVDSNMTADVSGKSHGVTTGSGFTGYLEIWPWNYTQDNTRDGYTGAPEGVPGGASGKFDYNDAHAGSAQYGSFQVHNITSDYKETVLAWNRHYDSAPDIGLGWNLSCFKQ